jgi:Na+/H+ antiporter NhaD/arsenite permease-like protein
LSSSLEPWRCATIAGVPAADPNQVAQTGAAARWRATAWRAAARRPVLDWITAVLLVLGLIFVAAGLLPQAEADATIRRILPLLLFLGSVIVLAELTADAGVFDVIAVRVAGLARGNYPALFVLCVLFAAATTTVLNLDTTAVLLTPVMLALARKAGIAVIPLAMTTVWLANTASLLLPVSNLTNLLAANRVALPAAAFASRMWPVQLASVVVTMVFLWVFFWRRSVRGADRYDPPPPLQPADPVLFWVAALACLLFITVIVTTGIELGFAAAMAAAPVVAVFAVRKRAALQPGLVPWRLLVFVVGLFLVVQTVSLHGLGTITQALVGTGDGRWAHCAQPRLVPGCPTPSTTCPRTWQVKLSSRSATTSSCWPCSSAPMSAPSSRHGHRWQPCCGTSGAVPMTPLFRCARSCSPAPGWPCAASQPPSARCF